MALLAMGCSESPTRPTTAEGASSFTITGAIREMLPDGTAGLPVAGARVAVVGKSGPVASADTDASGQYRLSGVGGVFDLTVSKDGFTSKTVHAGPVSANLTLDATLAPSLRTLVGVVKESPPTQTIPIGGATVEIVTGSLKGTRATTDGNGYYSMPGVWGDFDVAASRDGYDRQAAHVSASATVTRLDLTLQPDAQLITTTVRGRICADFGYWITPGAGAAAVSVPGDYPVQTHHFTPIHRAGPVAIDIRWVYMEDYSSEYLGLEIQCGSMTVQQMFAIEQGEEVGKLVPPDLRGVRVDGPLRFSVSTPSVCEIKPGRYRSFKGFTPWTEYQIAVSHPK